MSSKRLHSSTGRSFLPFPHISLVYLAPSFLLLSHLFSRYLLVPNPSLWSLCLFFVVFSRYLSAWHFWYFLALLTTCSHQKRHCLALIDDSILLSKQKLCCPKLISVSILLQCKLQYDSVFVLQMYCDLRIAIVDKVFSLALGYTFKYFYRMGVNDPERQTVSFKTLITSKTFACQAVYLFNIIINTISYLK